MIYINIYIYIRHIYDQESIASQMIDRGSIDSYIDMLTTATQRERELNWNLLESCTWTISSILVFLNGTPPLPSRGRRAVRGENASKPRLVCAERAESSKTTPSSIHLHISRL